jgi:glutathione S-transferase
MKLYYLTGACSLASAISLLEAGVKFDHAAVDRVTKKTKDGEDYLQVNPKGYVPALKLDNGEVLTENTALLAYIGDLNPAAKLIPPAGTLERFRVQEWLGYINGEIHKNFSPLFNPASTDAMKEAAKQNIEKRLAYVEQRLGSQSYLTGEGFTVADAYLYVVLSWRGRLGVSIEKFPKLTAFFERVAARPTVREARKAEGLPEK